MLRYLHVREWKINPKKCQGLFTSGKNLGQWVNRHAETSLLRWIIYTEYFVLSKFACWNLIPNVVIFGGKVINSWLGHKGGSLMNGIIVLLRETPENSLAPSSLWQYREKMADYEPESGFSTDTKSFITLKLDLASRVMRNNFLMLISHRVYTSLLYSCLNYDSEGQLLHLTPSMTKKEAQWRVGHFGFWRQNVPHSGVLLWPICQGTWKADRFWVGLRMEEKWHIASQLVLVIKNPPAYAEDKRDMGSIPGLGRSLEKEMATHSSILAWRISWTEEPGGLQSEWLQHVGQDWRNLPLAQNKSRLYNRSMVLCKLLCHLGHMSQHIQWWQWQIGMLLGVFDRTL